MIYMMKADTILWHSPREITKKLLKQELWFLRSAPRLMLIGMYMKFREDSLNGFQNIERTRGWQTEGGKTLCLSTIKGGDIISTKT